MTDTPDGGSDSGSLFHILWRQGSAVAVFARWFSRVASLCLAVNFNLEREVFPHVTVPNKGSAGVVIKAMIKQSQVECELAFISAPASRAPSWSC